MRIKNLQIEIGRLIELDFWIKHTPRKRTTIHAGLIYLTIYQR